LCLLLLKFFFFWFGCARHVCRFQRFLIYLLFLWSSFFSLTLSQIDFVERRERKKACTADFNVSRVVPLFDAVKHCVPKWKRSVTGCVISPPTLRFWSTTPPNHGLSILYLVALDSTGFIASGKTYYWPILCLILEEFGEIDRLEVSNFLRAHFTTNVKKINLGQ
jgi:hypothetical protein